MARTERVLSYLPRIYRPYPLPSVLYTVASAAGTQMDEVDNLLSVLMQAHWVDYADKGSDRIHDLALMAALFDLAPRPDEDVETFRTHLKSYVRTYLEGSATVPGVLRLAASTLALSLEEELEPGPDDPPYLIDVIRSGKDAALRLFGLEEADVSGTPPRPARVSGVRDLSSGADLSGGNVLQLAIDQDNIATVDLAEQGPAPDLWSVAGQINSALGFSAASHDANTLSLTSGLPGPEGEIQLGSPEDDAADALLGVAPRIYIGQGEQPAQVRGTIDHAPAGGVPLLDLSQVFYLRVAVDRGQPLEINCAGADPAATTLGEVVTRINDALGAEIASEDGHYLTLTSPTSGADSRLEVPQAPAHDAREKLLGSAQPALARGGSATAAQLVGRADLSEGVDLTTRYLLRLRIDEGQAQEIDCRGDHADATSLLEIAERINATLLAEVAQHDGRHLNLTSPTLGDGSAIEILEPSDPAADATDLILGVAPRIYNGTPAGSAILQGLTVLEEPLDLRHERFLWLAMDGGELQRIDCAGEDPANTKVQEVIDAINEAAGTTIAFRQAGRLILQSPTFGATSSLTLRAPQEEVQRAFYTRGRIREDAATTLFGFAGADITGQLPQPARLTGTVDLSRGADLRVAHTLRLQVDDLEPRDIRVADPSRPMVTLLPHLTTVINETFGQPIASDSSGQLMLISPTEGPQSRIAVGISTASDAAELLFGSLASHEATGRPAEQVRFVGMSDLARGLDVSETFRLRIGMDSRPLVEVDLQAAVPEDSPAILSPRQIAAAINDTLGDEFASHDGRRVILTSAEAGSGSKIRLEQAPADDALGAVFGLSEPRTYVGQDATTARLSGSADLADGVDLHERRHLSLEVDGQLFANIDCGAGDEESTTLNNIVQRINSAVGQAVAGQTDGKLVIISPGSGATSSVVLHESTAADARQKLLGDAPNFVIGEAGQPAILQGSQQLRRPVDLSRRSIITLRIDDGELREINCAGEDPAKTFPDEVVNAINTVFPGLAAVNGEQQLVLTAAWRVELLTQRYMTLFEYAPLDTISPEEEIYHGQSWTVTNDSVRPEPFAWTLRSLTGIDRPRLTNRDTSAWIQVNTVIPAGFTLHLRLTMAGQIEATMSAPGRAGRDVSEQVELYPGPSALELPVGRSNWQYHDCYGDRYDAAPFSRRPRKSDPDREPVDESYYAGGPICNTPGVFDQSHFYHAQQAGNETVFGSRLAALEAQATSAFNYVTHQAGQFELRLPADLPPQFGGRFNVARFASEASLVFEEAIFDLPEDPQALDELVNSRPSMVSAAVALIADEEVPIYDVPFNTEKPLVGGDAENAARAYLRQPGVPGFVELQAKEAGEWGNLILLTAPESETPGGFDVSVTYTGHDVFENAIPKVSEQLALARAAGVRFTVTRR
ncbi:MAG: hypothetical protein PVH18_00040 [Chloroflexota bacterium]|jgi:hypothetical protein